MKVPFIGLTLLALAIVFCIASASTEGVYPINGKISMSYRANSSYYAYTNPTLVRRAFSKITVSLVGSSLQKQSLVQSDGSFAFSEIPPGPYQLEVHSTEFHFTPLKVEVSRRESGKIKMKYLDVPGGLPAPFIIRPDAPLRYFQESQSMLSIYISMLSSPMLLMMFAVIGLMTCMQYMDPDAMQDLQNEVSGQKGKVEQPHMTLPGLIAKPKQGVKLSRQIAAGSSLPTRPLINDSEDSDSQEEDSD